MKILPPSPTSSGYAPLPAAPEKPRQNFYCIPAGIPIDAVEPKAIYAFLCHQRGDREGAYTALVSTAHTSPQFATLWGQKALELGERKAAAQIFSWTNIWLASANIPAPHDCKYAHFTRLNEVCAFGLGMTHDKVDWPSLTGFKKDLLLPKDLLSPFARAHHSALTENDFNLQRGRKYSLYVFDCLCRLDLDSVRYGLKSPCKDNQALMPLEPWIACAGVEATSEELELAESLRYIFVALTTGDPSEKIRRQLRANEHLSRRVRSSLFRRCERHAQDEI